MAHCIVIICSLVAFALASSAHAAKLKSIPSPCAFAEDQPRCETKIKGFTEDLPKANQGDYIAQREVAFCYATGCNGAISVDLIKACTWQTIIVSTEKSDNSDASNFRSQCGQLNEIDRNLARNNALGLFGKIYKTLMTKPLP